MIAWTLLWTLGNYKTQLVALVVLNRCLAWGGNVKTQWKMNNNNFIMISWSFFFYIDNLFCCCWQHYFQYYLLLSLLPNPKKKGTSPKHHLNQSHLNREEISTTKLTPIGWERFSQVSRDQRGIFCYTKVLILGLYIALLYGSWARRKAAAFFISKDHLGGWEHDKSKEFTGNFGGTLCTVFSSIFLGGGVGGFKYTARLPWISASWRGVKREKKTCSFFTPIPGEMIQSD